MDFIAEVERTYKMLDGAVLILSAKEGIQEMCIRDRHRLIRENSKDETEYKRFVDSLKASVLTAFYTPKEITDTIDVYKRQHGWWERHSHKRNGRHT